MSFMYFSEIYLKWNLSTLDILRKKSKYIWATLVLLESVFSLLYGRGGGTSTSSVQNPPPPKKNTSEEETKPTGASTCAVLPS